MHAVKPVEIIKFKNGQEMATPDLVVVEEPLEIRLSYGTPENRIQKSISVTMRTPTGHDFELVIGFLFTEGIIQSIEELETIRYCINSGKQKQENIVKVELKPSANIDIDKLNRHFYTTSSCGVCGKASIEAINSLCEVLPKKTTKLSNDFIINLPQILEKNQIFFQHTGGLHAAAIISQNTDIQIIREDIGRHNALDKAIGAALQQKLIPLQDFVLFMSSRASFELVQKSVMAGIPTLICVGAPSSLAIETAQNFGMNLIGFLRNDSYNIYC